MIQIHVLLLEICTFKHENAKYHTYQFKLPKIDTLSYKDGNDSPNILPFTSF